MSEYYLRYPHEVELSRHIAISRELQVAKAIERQKDLNEWDYRRLKQLEKIKAQREFLQLKEIKESRRILAEEEIRRERVMREQLQKQHIMHLEAANNARIERERQIDIQKQITQEREIHKAAMAAESKQMQLEHKLRNKQQADRNNTAVLSQQLEQQKIQKQISRISIEIGRIIDQRQDRKKKQLVQLEQLDKIGFQLKQAMRSSMVKQKALEESLSQLSKLIGV